MQPTFMVESFKFFLFMSLLSDKQKLYNGSLSSFPFFTEYSTGRKKKKKKKKSEKLNHFLILSQNFNETSMVGHTKKVIIVFKVSFGYIKKSLPKGPITK